MKKIIDHKWFKPQGETIGIIAYKNSEDDEGEIKFALGVGTGLDENQDALAIVDWGIEMKPEDIIDFFNINIK